MTLKKTVSQPRFKSYRLFVTAKELSGFFERHECRILALGMRTKRTFHATPIKEFLVNYDKYVKVILHNHQPLAAWREIPEAAPLRVNIGSPSDWYDVKPLKGGWHMPISRAPSISVAPQSIGWLDTRIELAALSMDFAYIGLAFTFPLVALNDRDEVVRRHENHPHYKLFLQLQKHFDAITSPCRFQTPAGERRTNLRVTSDGKEMLKNHRYLVRHKLQIL